MDKFTLACCNLLDRYPLYRHLTTDNEGKKHLRVLILGAGERLASLIRAVLTNGQLLDTDLEVNVAATYAEHECEMLLQRAPYLNQFMSVTLDHRSRTGPAPWRSLGSIAFESRNLDPNSVQKLMNAHTDYRYILISADDDEKTRRLAGACARFAGASTVIAYYEKKDSHSTLGKPGQGLLVSFGTAENEAFSTQAETIAYNLHYAYAKTQNDREPESKIRESFLEEYNYSSSMEAALHVKSKLACVGIMDEDPEEAARRFSRLMSQQPELEARLAAVEHRRWCVDKLLAGYGPVSDLGLIYQNGATTHDRSKKWHCCLTPCDDDGHSKLNDSDWSIKETDQRWNELDELDRMTLRIHRRCGELARENAPRIMDFLHRLQSDIAIHSELPEELNFEVRELTSAVGRLLQNNSRAISAVQRSAEELKRLLEIEESPFARIMLSTLSGLNALLVPCIEFTSRKDYKKQDLVQIRQIPFALTHKQQPILVKLISENGLDNLYSIWRLEPRLAVFVGYARSVRELEKLRPSILMIDSFLKTVFQKMEWRISVLVPEKLLSESSLEGVELIPMSKNDSTEMNECLEGLLSDARADYLDITGADYLLARGAEIAAAQTNAGVFYLNGSRFENVDRAVALAYSAPEKKLTVEEMLRSFGAAPVRSETDRLRYLADSYRALWELAWTSSHWSSFCSDVWNAYCNTPIQSYAFSGKETDRKPIQATVTKAAAASLLPALEKLRGLGIVETRVFPDWEESGGCASLRFTVKRLNEDFSEFLTWACGCFRSGASFEVKTDGITRLVYREPAVKDMTVPSDLLREYRSLLVKMQDKKLVSDIKWNQAARCCSFRLSSGELLACIQNSGRILEYYLYDSALKDGGFDDVETGYSFHHEEEGLSADNEVDIICIKGYSSLFISAKMGDKLSNYYLYEISFLASRFGLNPRSVLAAPNVAMFRKDPSCGKTVFTPAAERARNRNVYLLGTECFQTGEIGIILSNIASGKKDWWTI